MTEFADWENITYVIRSSESYVNAGVSQILNNNNRLAYAQAYSISSLTYRLSKKHSVPMHVVLAIMFVESAYRLDAVNPRSDDYGIMQVNEYHIKHRGVNKQRLLTDLAYSIEQGIIVFKWFYKRYPLDHAIMRYNCGTRKNCVNWSSVKRYLRKVKEAM